MAGDPSVTVVVATFNGARFLGHTLDSLGAQDESVEVLVVDDGSSDGSADIAERHTAVRRVVRQSNRGVAAARNRGLALAAGRYVAFVDQDDLWHRTRASSLLGLAGDSGAAAVASTEQVFALREDHDDLLAAGDPRVDWPSHWIDEGEEGDLVSAPLVGTGEVHEITLERLMQGAAFVTTSVLYERIAAITAGGCSPIVKAADDHVLNVNVARIFGPIVQVATPSLFYRIHPAATTNSSPLVAPLLTLQLALRHGRALPRKADLGPNLTHLLNQVADQDGLSVAEQVGLLLLSSPAGDRTRRLRSWARRRAVRGLRAKSFSVRHRERDPSPGSALSLPGES